MKPRLWYTGILGLKSPTMLLLPAVEEDDGASGLSRRDPPGMEPQAVIAGEVQVPGLLLPEPIHSVFHQSRITGSDFLPQGVVVLPGVFMPPDAGDAKYQVTANHSQQAQGQNDPQNDHVRFPPPSRPNHRR